MNKSPHRGVIKRFAMSVLMVESYAWMMDARYATPTIERIERRTVIVERIRSLRMSVMVESNYRNRVGT